MSRATSILIVLVVIVLGVGLAVSRKNKTSNNQSTSSQTASSQKPANQTRKSPQATGANEVSIINMNFSPASLTVKKGGSIKWINNDNVAHTIAENDGKNGPNSPSIQPGGTYSFTFNEAGVFHYDCSIHPSMTGVVTVTQ